MKNKFRRFIAYLLVLMLMSSDIAVLAEEVIKTLILPAALRIIDEEAFAGNTSIEKVIVPDSTTEIRSRAFADSSMTELELPDSLTFIAEDAFEGCSEFALTVPENCYAYDRCVELGLIKLDEPDPSVIESAHPYPDEFDYTWTYDAGEGTESVTITFSADTETEEDYDFIYLYTLDDVEVGQYSGTELAGQSVTIDGTGFKLRLTSDEAWDGGNAYYGFKLDSIVPKKAVPLTFESITAESSAVNAGETIRWTVATTGGKAPVYYDYTILLGEEEVATGTVEAPNTIEYTPVRAGEYKLSVIARDSADVVLPAQVSEAVTVAPSTAYPESAHPYASRMDQSWFYAAEENVESLTVTFSEATKTERGCDYIWLYDQNGTQIGKYDGTTLAGQSIEIMGSAFTIRLTSDSSNEYHGFTITNIEKYIPGPLTFVSLTVDKSKAKTGDLITWTMETEGGRRPVTYEYTVTLNGETKYTGSVTRPEQIAYVPMTAGDYTMSVVAKDAVGNELPAQISKVRITERGETAAEYFTVVQTSGNFAKITGYTGTDTAVVIPSVIGDYTIESIADRAFQDNTEIISITLPGTLKQINYRAFRGCTNLRSVYIPDSVTYIGEEAFYNCSKLADINYPLGWTSASRYGNVFKGTALKTIVIPEGVTSIPEHAFRYCTNFAYFNLPSTIETIGGYAFADCTGLTSLDIPEKVKVLNSGLLQDCTGLVSVILPASLERIDNRTFCGCTSLASMYIPDSVTYIGHYAFFDCRKLADINYPLGWTSASSSGCVFEGTALKTIVIPEGVTSIPAYAFRYCDNFAYFNLPSTIETIGSCAFDGCTGLTSLDIPEKVKVLNSGLLQNCTGLVSVSIPAQATTFEDRAFAGCTHLASVTLPETLERIDYGTFRDCTSLTSMYIPDSVTYIGEEAFYNCSKLADINYPLGWTSASSNGSVFEGTALKTIVIPEGVTSIPAYAFRDCHNFAYFNLPSTIETIGDYAFDFCTGLTSLDIPEKVKVLNSGLLQDCTRLVSVILPASLERIDDSTFRGCTSLASIYIPDSVTYIGAQAFYNCSKLADINYPLGWTSASSSGSVFGGTALKTIVIPEGVTSIPQYAFRYCTNFTYFELPDSLQSIPAYAFAGCTGLEKIWIPEGIEPQYDEEGNQTSFVPIASTAFNNVSTSTMSIHGVSGSYAETFADSKGYPFVAEAFEYTPATLSGTVTDAAGNPLSGVTVTVYKGPTTNYPFGSTTTDSTGAWSVSNVKVGSYYGVGFEKAGYTFSPSHPTCTAVPSSGYTFDNVIGGTTGDTRSGFAVSHGTTNGLVAGAGGGRGMTITVVSTNDWTVESDSEWITLSVSGGKSEETFYPTIAENTGYESRTGYITVRCDGYTPAIIRVVQNAAVRTASIAVHTPDERCVTDNSAVVKGLLTWGDGESAASYQNVGIQYGLDDGSDWIATISAELDSESGELITTVGELITGEVYRFRAVAQHAGTLEWMESEPVTVRIQAYCEHQYGDMIYAYDASVQAYHDRYINEGNTFLPTIFVDEEETAETHSVRHPYICVCSLCDRFEVIYANGVTEHNFDTITEIVLENIMDDTHDVYQITRVMCTTALNDGLCGYIQSEDKVLVEEGTAHTFIEGTCVCGECNVVWNAAMSGNLNIGVSVKSGHPDADKNYLFIAEDDQGLHYSATIPAGSVSRTFGVKSDLGLLRAKTYAIYILPEGISLTDDNREEYYVCDIAVPLFNGKMVTSVYSGDTELRDKNKVYVDDVIRINWDGSYGVDHAQVVVKLNNDVVVNETYNYSGPGTITLDSTTLGAAEGDTLSVTVTVDPNAVATASVRTSRAAAVQPVSYTWTGMFVAKPKLGYAIELDWNGVKSDVTDQKIYMSTASGAPNYFGLRAYLDGELINLTDPDNCMYEWKLFSQETRVENGVEVAYAYDLTEDPNTDYFKGVHSGSWWVKRIDGFTFYFNENGDRFKGYIELRKKGEVESLAYVTIQITKNEMLISGAMVGYSTSDREYNEVVSISNALYNSWYLGASLAERRLWFDLNLKRSLIDITVPSNTVECFFDACEDSFLWDLRYNGVLLTLKIGDFLGNAASDIIDFAVAGIKWSSSWPAALYSDITYGTGSFSHRFEETTNLLRNFEKATVDGKIVNSFTHDDKHTEAIINYLTVKAESMAQQTGRSDFEKTTAQNVINGIGALREVTDKSLKSPLDKLIEWVSIEKNTDFAGAFEMEYNDIKLGEVIVDVKIGTKTKSFTLEQVLSASALTDYSVDYSNRYAKEFLEQLRDGGIDVNAEQASKQGFIWAIIDNDTKVELYNEMYPANRMMGKIGDFLKNHNVDAWLEVAEAGINGYKAWNVAEQYDKLLVEFEIYLNSLEPEDNAWVQDVLDELADVAANKTLIALEAIGETYVKNGLKKLSSEACREVLTKLLGEGAEKAAAQLGTLAGAVWSGIELGNMLSNAAGSVGTIPSVSEVIKLYEEAQEGLYKAMDKYTTNPSLQSYNDLKMKAELYTILKGSAIVSINAVYRADQESIKARFVNWVSWQAKITAAYYSALFTGDWAAYYSAYGQDKRVTTISDIDKAMYGELEQMQNMLELLFPLN